MKNISLTHKLAALASTAMLLTNVLAAGIASADTATADLSAAGGGTFSVSAATISLAGTNSASYLTPANGLVDTDGATVTVTDSRLGNLGWTVESKITDFGLASTSIKAYPRTSVGVVHTNTVTVGTDSIYNGNCVSVDATFGGDTATCGVLKLTVVAPAGTITGASTTIPAGTPGDAASLVGSVLSSYGVNLTLSATTGWTSGDIISIYPDKLPIGTTFTTEANSSLSANSGYNTEGMYLGNQSQAGYSATNVVRANKDVTAPQGTGVGVFTYNALFKQGVHGKAIAGTYKSTVTLTLASVG